MAYETILADRDQGVGVITLNRPDVLNAMNFQLATELDQALTEMEADDEVRAIVITGAGDRAFSAGADIHEQREDAEKLSEEERARRGAIRSEHFWHLAACAKPTIGALKGLAYGGGAVVASTLDLRVGCEGSVFRFLAAVYGRLNSTWTLPMIVGWPIAKELLFTGREVPPEEAYRIGLLNYLVPADQVMPKALELGDAIAKNRPEAVQGIKGLLVQDVGAAWRQMWQNERDYITKGMAPWTVEQSFGDFLARRER